MEIKDKLVLDGMTWAAAENIENNTVGAFQISNSNTPGYYIFGGQVMHILYRENIHVMHFIFQLSLLKVN